MQMARDFGVSPWELEDKVPAEWVDRWLADQEAQIEAEPKQITQPGVGSIKRRSVI